MCSDFGLDDHFAGVMKGVVFSINPRARVVDLTHKIPQFDIARAAFAVEKSYRFFPKGTVHLAVVDPGVGTDRKPLAVCADGNFFVGPDNGIFTPVLRGSASFSAYSIENPCYTLNPLGSTFHGRDIFAPAAAHISLGVDLSLMGSAVESPVEIDIEKPVSFGGAETGGVVIHTDSFGNLVSNIESRTVPGAVEVEICGVVIDGISGGYSERAPGEAVAVRGSSGFIEIALNRGSAFERFGGGGTEITVRKKGGGAKVRGEDFNDTR